MIAHLYANIVNVLELHHRTDCKANRIDHYYWEAWSTPHGSHWRFLGQWQFLYFYFSHQTYSNILKHTQTYSNIRKHTQTYSNIHNHTQTYTNIHIWLLVTTRDREGKGRRVRPYSAGSNPQCYNWKLAAQTTAPYGHPPLPPTTTTTTHTHTCTKI